MQQFFNTLSPFGQSVLRPTQWSYAKAGLERNLATVKEYYRVRPFAVKSNHILARMLNNLGVSFNHNLERFYDIIDSRALNLSMTFKMTSSLHRGGIFKGVFYGPDSSEILMAVDDSFNPFEVEKNWMTTSAVKVIKNERCDLNLLLPNGKKTSTDSGVSVFTINIPMLAVQFRSFLKYQMEHYYSKGLDTHTVAQFIHMYVLPNMLDSQLDCCLFNRAFCYVTGQPLEEATFKHSAFYLTDFTKQVDVTYLEIAEHFKHSDKHYKIILKSFPAIEKEDFEKFLVLPDNTPTRQIFWAEMLARIKALEFLANASPNSGTSLNQSENNLFLKTFSLYRSDKTIQSALSRDMYKEVEATVKDLESKLR